MRRFSHAERETLLALIKRYATLAEFQTFLEFKDLPDVSGHTWQDVLEQHVWPALQGRPPALTDEDLLGFLRPYEEYGRQHIWLFSCPESEVAGFIAQALARPELDALPRIVDQPEPAGRLFLVDVRKEAEDHGDALILKFVETRTYRVNGEEDVRDGTSVITYQLKRRRILHVARLHCDGVLELCVTSSPEDRDLDRLWHALAPFLRRKNFPALDIMAAKGNFWADRGRLVNGLKYYFAHLKDTQGVALTAAAATTRRACLARNAGSVASVESFLGHDAPFFDEFYFRFPLRSGRAKAPGQVYVCLLTGPNVFSVSQCGRDDHEFAYRTILELNQQQLESAAAAWPRRQRVS